MLGNLFLLGTNEYEVEDNENQRQLNQRAGDRCLRGRRGGGLSQSIIYEHFFLLALN